MWNVKLALALVVVAFVRMGRSHGDPGPRSLGHVSVVVVGGTGDLARKYLWQGFFQLYADQVSSGYSFSFYGGALSATDQGTPLLYEILKGVACPAGLSAERCALLREQFLRLARYSQLRSAEDYSALSRHIEQQARDEGLAEAGRLFYLSVPAFAYADIARKVNGSCRPARGAWLRVVLEKPFGQDLESALQLSRELEEALKEEEMYRIDHYLGKQVVSHILPFRQQNRRFLDPIWNKQHIERVEIVLKETLDAKGRIQFYDQYGVIRDVIQNHLTEVMTLLTMAIPANLSNHEEVLQNKLRVFSALRRLDKRSAVIGQYESYITEMQTELNKTKDHISLTPTFAGVLVHIDTAQFEGVPIILTSGKRLDERVGYARVLFRNHFFCVQGCSNPLCKLRHIVFHFGHGALGYPAILVSRNLFQPALVEPGWVEGAGQEGVVVLGSPVSDHHVQTPAAPREAYAELLSHVFRGQKKCFVSRLNLLASWGFWTPLLDGLARVPPRPYPGGEDNGHLLDFRLQGGEAAFANEEVVLISLDRGTADSFQVMQGTYRGGAMVSAWPEGLVERLANDIQAAAEEAVRDGGSFHLALSGGSSPLALFRQLARHHHLFPWARTHLWMVDERCVPPTEDGSNFRVVHDHLLQHVRVPYFNVHPMPVQLNQRLCVEEDGGALSYERAIAQHVNASSLHFVLLGVGHDMHTASLFPGEGPEAHGDALVALTESPAKPHQRMSLTLGAINRAQTVAVLVMGKGKHEVVTQLSRVKVDVRKWPITGVAPGSGRLVWYIDYDALLG